MTSTRPARRASERDEIVDGPSEVSKTRSGSNAAVFGLFLIALLAAVYFARALLIPVAAAIYLELVLAPVVRKLWKWGIPSPIGAALVVGVAIVVASAAIYQLSGPANEWIERSPGVLRRAELRLSRLKAPVEKVNRAAEQVEEMADDVARLLPQSSPRAGAAVRLGQDTLDNGPLRSNEEGLSSPKGGPAPDRRRSVSSCVRP